MNTTLSFDKILLIIYIIILTITISVGISLINKRDNYKGLTNNILVLDLANGDLQNIGLQNMRILGAKIHLFSPDNKLSGSDIVPIFWKYMSKDIESVYDDFDGFVIIHGPETLVYTASMLTFLLENLNKPIVFVDATKINTDLVSAIDYCSGDEPLPINDILIMSDGNINKATRSTMNKNGKISSLPMIGEPDFYQNELNVLKFNGIRNVVIIKYYPGFSGANLIKAIKGKQIRGAIIEMHNNSLLPEDPSLYKTIYELSKRDFLIGIVGVEFNEMLNRIGLINLHDMSSEVAFTKLLLLTNNIKNPKIIKQIMNIPLKGEFIKEVQQQTSQKEQKNFIKKKKVEKKKKEVEIQKNAIDYGILI